MGRLTGKVAIITGASSGIGRAAALLFAADGARLVLGDIDVEGGQATEQQVKDAGGEAVFQRIDVADAADHAALVATALGTYGRLDVAFNNAGVEAHQADILDQDQAEWDRVIAINLTGVWYAMRAQIPAMLDAGGGSIVNTASVAGLRGFGLASPYVASKHGLVGLTRSVALEYAGRGIRVNALCPGIIATPMVTRAFAENPQLEAALGQLQPVGRMGDAAEVAEAAAWLCSEASAFVTGTAMAVDGGFTAK